MIRLLVSDNAYFILYIPSHSKPTEIDHIINLLHRFGNIFPEFKIEDHKIRNTYLTVSQQNISNFQPFNRKIQMTNNKVILYSTLKTFSVYSFRNKMNNSGNSNPWLYTRISQDV